MTKYTKTGFELGSSETPVIVLGVDDYGNTRDEVLETHKLARAGVETCLLYTSPSPRDLSTSRMPSSA